MKLVIMSPVESVSVRLKSSQSITIGDEAIVVACRKARSDHGWAMTLFNDSFPAGMFCWVDKADFGAFRSIRTFDK